MPIRTIYTSVEIGGTPATVLDLEVSEDYSAACRRFSLTTTTSGLAVNDVAVIRMGFTDNNATMITDGYVDTVTAERPPGVYRIEGRDKLKEAIDYFIVVASLDKDDFFNPGQGSPSSVVSAILTECGLSLDASSGDTGWTIGTATDGTPFQLKSAWDAIQEVCVIGVWKVWVHSNGDIEFAQVIPEPGAPSATIAAGDNLLSARYVKSDDNLRNRIVVIGAMKGDGTNYTATTSAVSPFLPAGFYKTCVISTDLIGSDATAQATANAQFDRFNKLDESVPFEAEGNPNIHVMDTVTITEPFSGISGDWFVYEITHTIDNNGYRMRGTGVK